MSEEIKEIKEIKLINQQILHELKMSNQFLYKVLESLNDIKKGVSWQV